jgi:CRISPR type III-B/RAMP module RAMP protein Cmr6
MFALPDTQKAWSQIPINARSRSILFERLADPTLKDSAERTPRKDFFREVAGLRVQVQKVQSWLTFLTAGLRCESNNLLFAQLLSRLMVDMAGGVMENAGLCLDRFGVPFIPGSAVKGCARRMAIQRLLETETPEAEDPQTKKADLLVQIALVFGWGKQDWTTKRDYKPRPKSAETDEQFEFRWQNDWEKKRSDFAYACGEGRWNGALIEAVQRSLWKQVFRTDPPEDTATFARAWKQRLSHFAGKVQFLPAYPLNVKLADTFQPTPDELGELELDVVTCHHRKYYEGDPNYTNAPDTEEPTPVVFPAVAPGHVFVFAVRAQQPTMNSIAPLARRWLADSLSTFGLGAKTAAGYGWFDCADALQQAVRAGLTRAVLKPNEELLKEFRGWADKQVRRSAAAFMFQDAKNWPKSGREATDDYQFSLVKFILAEKAPLFIAEKSHQGSDFAKGVKRLADKFKLPLP